MRIPDKVLMLALARSTRVKQHVLIASHPYFPRMPQAYESWCLEHSGCHG